MTSTVFKTVAPANEAPATVRAQSTVVSRDWGSALRLFWGVGSWLRKGAVGHFRRASSECRTTTSELCSTANGETPDECLSTTTCVRAERRGNRPAAVGGTHVDTALDSVRWLRDSARIESRLVEPIAMPERLRRWSIAKVAHFAYDPYRLLHGRLAADRFLGKLLAFVGEARANGTPKTTDQFWGRLTAREQRIISDAFAECAPDLWPAE